jgi:hypothetical protein
MKSFSSLFTSFDAETMSDEKLYECCQKWGAQALEARRKFLGLLPEVQKRRLYAAKKYCSIYEFAAKLAGVSAEQVDTALRLDRKFSEMPKLHKALVEGEISINKLTRIASVATIENQEELMEKIQILPQKAVEVLVRDIKYSQTEGVKMEPNVTGFTQVGKDTKLLRAQKPHQLLHFDEDVTTALLELQNKGIDISDIIRNALNNRKINIAQKKEKLVAETKETKSRYIKTEVRKLIEEEHGTKCSIPGCERDARKIHHTQRFALARAHDPRFMAPLCEGHHQLAHAVDQRFWEKRKFKVTG